MDSTGECVNTRHSIPFWRFSQAKLQSSNLGIPRIRRCQQSNTEVVKKTLFRCLNVCLNAIVNLGKYGIYSLLCWVVCLIYTTSQLNYLENYILKVIKNYNNIQMIVKFRVLYNLYLLFYVNRKRTRIYLSLKIHALLAIAYPPP